MGRLLPIVLLTTALLPGAARARPDHLRPSASSDVYPPLSPAEAIPHFSHRTHARLSYFQHAIANERKQDYKVFGTSDADHLPCVECHALDPKSGATRTPGAQGHAPCSNPECHGARLDAREPRPLCGECHGPGIVRFRSAATQLVHRTDADREFRWRFTHDFHMRLERFTGTEKSGKSEGCDGCHRVEREGDSDQVVIHRPGHAECLPCHGSSESEPSLTRCNSCHSIGEARPPRSHGAFRVNEHFQHAQHRFDPRPPAPRLAAGGQGWSRYDKSRARPMRCGACHMGVLQSPPPDKRGDAAAEAALRRTETALGLSLLDECGMHRSCLDACHNDGGKRFAQDLRYQCVTCHGSSPPIGAGRCR